MNAVPLHGVTFTSLGYGAESFVRPGVLDFYVVMYLISGAGRFRYGSDSVERTAGQAVVVSTRKPLDMRLSADFAVACLRIEKSTLTQQLRSALDDDPSEPLEFDLAMNERDDHVALWQQFFCDELRALNSPGHPFHANPFMARDAISVLVGRLLHIQPHSRSADLERISRAPVSSRRIEKVLDYVQAHPGERHTRDSLATLACCSKEALNNAFKRDVGVPLMKCVEFSRLQGAHRDLLVSDPDTTMVRSVARRWGFRQVGRFAVVYHALFGEHRHETLRRSGRAAMPTGAALIEQIQRLWKAQQTSK